MSPTIEVDVMSSRKDLVIGIGSFVAGCATLFGIVLLAGTIALADDRLVGDSGIREFAPIGLRWLGSLAVGYILILGFGSATRHRFELPTAPRALVAGFCSAAILFSLMMVYGSGMSSIGRVVVAALCGAAGAGQALLVSNSHNARPLLDAA